MWEWYFIKHSHGNLQPTVISCSMMFYLIFQRTWKKKTLKNPLKNFFLNPLVPSSQTDKTWRKQEFMPMSIYNLPSPSTASPPPLKKILEQETMHQLRLRHLWLYAFGYPTTMRGIQRVIDNRPPGINFNTIIWYYALIPFTEQ